MKRFYITEGLIKYSITTKSVENGSHSAYDTSIHIHMVGEKFPVWGAIIKGTDNARKIAKDIIKTWTEK